MGFFEVERNRKHRIFLRVISWSLVLQCHISLKLYDLTTAVTVIIIIIIVLLMVLSILVV